MNKFIKSYSLECLRKIKRKDYIRTISDNKMNKYNKIVNTIQSFNFVKNNLYFLNHCELLYLL